MRALVLGVVVAVSAVVAILLHRNGHTQGDDFALYLRQARSVFDGDSAAVVADNRFAVLNSDRGFSPLAYPWGWPLVLAPFVHLWGLDFDRLKLIEVAIWCTWLVLLHGIIRRRAGRAMALGVVAVIGSAPLYLAHTDQLITEFPHIAAVAVVIWWYDRIKASSALVDASPRRLVILGVLVTVAFNMRREGVVLISMIAVVQFFELVTRSGAQRWSVSGLEAELRARWRAVATPHVSFALSMLLFQLLMPTMLLPDNGNSRRYIDDRFGDYASTLTEQLGLGTRPALGGAIVVIAFIGAVIGVRRRPALDGPIVVVAVLSALAISTHFRMVDRYWFQITPWVLYFAAVAFSEAVSMIVTQRTRLAAVAVVPLAALVVAHVVAVPDDIGRARDFNAAGRVQIGPANPDVIPIFEAVNTRTPPTAVIAYFRARTMTLMTDRRSIQTSSLTKMQVRADYYAQRIGEDYWQPQITRAEGLDLGFEIVWSDSRWILWKLGAPEVTAG